MRDITTEASKVGCNLNAFNCQGFATPPGLGDKRPSFVLFCPLLYFVGSPARHIMALEELAKRRCIGEPSIQNALTMAESRLK